MLDSSRLIDPDTLENENARLAEALARYKENIFKMADSLDFDWLYIAKSADDRLCLVSWDTRRGGTEVIYETLALFKGTDGSIFSKVVSDTTDEGDNSTMHYDTVYTVRDGDKTFYLAQGFGQGSTALPWQEVRVLALKGSDLVEPAFFPDRKSTVFVEFDTHQFGEEDRIPTIKVREGGRRILVPVATEEEGFGGKYRQLVWSGSTYVAAP
ncbi:hypothetical protein [Dinghuibacter silviterrae]|nr:hypothetical protein [Dinghuibacter silviterrae]